MVVGMKSLGSCLSVMGGGRAVAVRRCGELSSGGVWSSVASARLGIPAVREILAGAERSSRVRGSRRKERWTMS